MEEAVIITLGTITTWDETGRHFTEYANSEHIQSLEEAGLIKVHRPRHPVTGYLYGQREWAVSLTEEGHLLVEANEELFC